jgi:hypothetical protein
MSTPYQLSVKAVTLTNITMQQAVETLREMRIPVCFEQVSLAPERARRLADGHIEYERTHFDITIPGGTIRDALDALCRTDQDYVWEQVGSKPIYVVYPVGESALEWTMPAQDFTGMDWIDAIQRLFQSNERTIEVFPRGLERQPRAVLPASLSRQSVARRWLTTVVDYINQGRYWTLGGVGGSRTLVIGQVALSDDAH